MFRGRLQPQEAQRALERFARRCGKGSFMLLLHAAVPQGLRQDLLRLLRVNFLGTDGYGSIVEADVLLAPFCDDLGGGYFELDPEIRRQCLDHLDELYCHEPVTHSDRIAAFLLTYVDRRLKEQGAKHNNVFHDWLEIQRWVAASFLAPRQTAEEFAGYLAAAVEGKDAVASLNISALASAVSLPLSAFGDLLAYADGFEALRTGDEERAERRLKSLGKNAVKVGRVTLPSLVPQRQIGMEADQSAPLPTQLLVIRPPALPTIYVGREELIDNIVAQFSQSQGKTLMLLGPPGIGKWTLAAEAAHAAPLQKLFHNGTLWLTSDAIDKPIEEVGSAIMEMIPHRDDVRETWEGLENTVLVIIPVPAPYSFIEGLSVWLGEWAAVLAVGDKLPSDILGHSIIAVPGLSEHERMDVARRASQRSAPQNATAWFEFAPAASQGNPLALSLALNFCRASEEGGSRLQEIWQRSEEPAFNLLAEWLFQKLPPNDQARLSRLSSSAARTTLFTFEQIQNLWRTSRDETEQSVGRMVDSGLIEPWGELYRLHGLVAELTREWAHYVLLIHARTDERFAQQLATDLRREGIAVELSTTAEPDTIKEAYRVLAILGADSADLVIESIQHAAAFIKDVLTIECFHPAPNLDFAVGEWRYDMHDPKLYDSNLTSLIHELRAQPPMQTRLIGLPPPPRNEGSSTVLDQVSRLFSSEVRRIAIVCDDVSANTARATMIAAAYDRDLQRRFTDIVWLELADGERVDQAYRKVFLKRKQKMHFPEILSRLVLIHGVTDASRLQDVALDRPILFTTRDSDLAVRLGATIVTLPGEGVSRGAPSSGERKERDEARRWLDERRDELSAGRDIELLWLAAQAMRKGQEDVLTGWSHADWHRLVPEFGQDIADAAREGLLAFWRRERPAIRPQDRSETSVPLEIPLGLIGLAIAANEGLDFTSLSDSEAENAALYGMQELNQPPEWMTNLVAVREDVVRQVVGRFIDIAFKVPDGPATCLETLFNSSTALRTIGAELAVIHLNIALPLSSHVLTQAFQLAVSQPDPRNSGHMLLLAQKIGTTGPAAFRVPALCAWLWYDAEQAWPVVLSFVEGAEDPKATMVSITAALHDWTDDIAHPKPDFMRRKFAATMLSAIERLVPPEEDLVREGAYYAEPRDKAEWFRGQIRHTSENVMPLSDGGASSSNEPSPDSFRSYIGESVNAYFSCAHTDLAADGPDLSRIFDLIEREIRTAGVQGFTRWLDWERPPWGEDWRAASDRAIREADLFFLFLSPAWLASKTCRNELDFFRKRQAQLGGNRIFVSYIRELDNHERVEHEEILAELDTLQVKHWQMQLNTDERTLKLACTEAAQEIKARLRDLAKDPEPSHMGPPQFTGQRLVSGDFYIPSLPQRGGNDHARIPVFLRLQFAGWSKITTKYGRFVFGASSARLHVNVTGGRILPHPEFSTSCKAVSIAPIDMGAHHNVYQISAIEPPLRGNPLSNADDHVPLLLVERSGDALIEVSGSIEIDVDVITIDLQRSIPRPGARSGRLDVLRKKLAALILKNVGNHVKLESARE